MIKQTISKSLQKVRAENTVRDELRQGSTLVQVFEKHGIL
jgi:hypothetical protein